MRQSIVDVFSTLTHSVRVAQAVCGGGGRGEETQVNEIHVQRGYHFRARRPLGSGPGALPTRPVVSFGLARLCPGALSTLEVHSTLLDLHSLILMIVSHLVSRDSNPRNQAVSSTSAKFGRLDSSCTDTAIFSVPSPAARRWAKRGVSCLDLHVCRSSLWPS